MCSKLIKVVMVLPFLALPVMAGCAHGYVGVGVGDERPYLDRGYGHHEWQHPVVVVRHEDFDHGRDMDRGRDWHEANERW
ncbi:MAG TPA: hypothetical protein VH253_05630 [Phycisphaerae bacterium]|nr:hypothetical protein [Phycisphaerae bacterium]